MFTKCSSTLYASGSCTADLTISSLSCFLSPSYKASAFPTPPYIISITDSHLPLFNFSDIIPLAITPLSERLKFASSPFEINLSSRPRAVRAFPKPELDFASFTSMGDLD